MNADSQPAKVQEAGRWLASIPSADRPRPIVPHLRKQFGLSAAQAIEALREANSKLGGTA